MRYRQLGNTGLKVSEIGMGCWAIGGNQFGNSYGATNDEESIQTIRRAVELGCNFFDTADVYGHGHSEELLGQALRHVRNEVIIATKVGGNFYGPYPKADFGEKYILFAVEKSLERFQTDTIDIYQLHNPSLEMIQEGSIFRTLEKLKKQGKIRFYGISIHDPAEGLAAMEMASPSAIQVVYNVIHREAEAELLSKAKEKGVGIIAREPLCNGFLTGKYKDGNSFTPGDIRHDWPREYVEEILKKVEAWKKQISPKGSSMTHAALQFVLSNGAVSCAIPGAKTVKQIEENLGTTRVE